MHIFISHKREDSAAALNVAETLKQNGHTYYLDVVDNYIHKGGDDLAAHIRAELGKCDCLLAVVSSSTKGSSWVPWEIGVATEKDYPLGTYLIDTTAPLEFMMKWPVLKSRDHLVSFAKALSSIPTRTRNLELMQKMASRDAKRGAVREFHEAVKKSTGQ